MESKYPPWQLIYYYFDKWNKTGLLSALVDELVAGGRKRRQMKAHSSTVAICSQTLMYLVFQRA